MGRDETLAFWIEAPGRGELRGERIPAPRVHEASVRTLYSGVSRGYRVGGLRRPRAAC